MGSSPIRVAICNLGSLLVLIPYLALYSAFASVAQLVEQGTENPRVSGSIPPCGTRLSLTVSQFAKRFFFFQNDTLQTLIRKITAVGFLAIM